jgi:drug/metabolite transporter (DMT)-like permease
MTNIWAALALMSNAFTWGVSWWPFRQLQAMGVHALWSTACIYLVALIALLLIRPAAWRGFVHRPGLWVLLIAAGLTNVGFNWAVTVGDVVRVVLLFYLMPAWVVVLAWPLLGEKPTGGSLARLALALAGVLLVLKTPGSPWPWPHDLADLLALMGGLAFGLTNILLRKLHGSAPESETMLAMFGGGAVMALLAAWLGMGVVTALPALSGVWPLWVLGLSLFILIGNLGLQFGAARLSASATSIIMLSEIVFASASSVALGASALSTTTLAGGGLILLAAVWSALAPAPDLPGSATAHTDPG